MMTLNGANVRKKLLDIIHGRMMDDIRNSRGLVNTYMKLKEARNMIPQINETSQNVVQEF
jgi:hypothetical protein